MAKQSPFETEPTEGPWFVVEHVNGEWTIQAGQPGGGECVARRYGLSNKANARLIAAAPTLLAACEEALQCFRFEIEETGAVKDRLITAIKAAKGPW